MGNYDLIIDSGLNCSLPWFKTSKQTVFYAGPLNNCPELITYSTTRNQLLVVVSRKALIGGFLVVKMM